MSTTITSKHINKLQLDRDGQLEYTTQSAASEPSDGSVDGNRGCCASPDQDVYPGVSLCQTLEVISGHFSSLWKETLEDEAAGFDEVDICDEFPLDLEDFEPLFHYGDFVRVKGTSSDAWAEYYPHWGGYYSKQPFQIVGMWLNRRIPGKFENGINIEWEQDEDGQFQADEREDRENGNPAGNNTALTKIADNIHENADLVEDECMDDGVGHDESCTLSVDTMDLSDAIQDLSTADDDDDDDDDDGKSPACWEDDCWYYKVIPTTFTLDYPGGDIMLWKEENLVFDAGEEDSDYEDGDEDGDEDEHEDEHEDEDEDEDEDSMTEYSESGQSGDETDRSDETDTDASERYTPQRSIRRRR